MDRNRLKGVESDRLSAIPTDRGGASVGGFDAPKSIVRASLGTLDDAAYTAISKKMREPVDAYYQRWEAEKK